jgi:hypothetical protein
MVKKIEGKGSKLLKNECCLTLLLVIPLFGEAGKRFKSYFIMTDHDEGHDGFQESQG